jgi:hypothetical protein
MQAKNIVKQADKQTNKHIVNRKQRPTSTTSYVGELILIQSIQGWINFDPVL